MLPDKSIRCPATGFTKTCHSIVSKYTCPKWVHLLGEDPQGKGTIDQFGCVDTFLPKLLIENSQLQRQTGAAVESLRNRVAEANGSNHDLLTAITLHDGRVAPKLIGQG